MLVMVGLAAGVGPAFASGTSSHYANGWSHGFTAGSNYGHPWMTRDGSSSARGYVGVVWYLQPWCGGGSQYHSSEWTYVANHIHNDYGDAGYCWTDPVEGHVSSPDPYLGHHAH